MKTLADVHLDRLEVLESVPDSPAELFEFNRETLITEAIAIAERTRAGIVPLRDKVAKLREWQNNPKKTPQSIRDSLSLKDVNGAGVLLPDGFCVVDTDTAEAEQWARKNLPPTFTVQTHKGYHRYYATSGPIRQDRSGIHKGVDVLSRRNYAVYVGSVHPDTGQVEYRHTNRDRGIESLPQWLYERLRDAGEGKRAEKPRKARIETPTAVEVSESAAKNAREVISYLTSRRPNTLDNLRDASDGRDKRVYQVVLSLLQSGCGGVDDVMAVLSQFPLWAKVAEQKDPMAYLTQKVESAQTFIEENPAQLTVLHWRRKLSGANLKPGLMKVLEAIGYEAFRQTKERGQEVTRLTLSARKVAVGSSMGRNAASGWMRKAEEERWIKTVFKPPKGSSLGTVYLLTLPRSGGVAEVVNIDVGHDAFRHGVLASALPVYKELHRGAGKASELVERMGNTATIKTMRNNLGKLETAKVAEKAKMIWSLTEDHEMSLDLHAIEAGVMGKREKQKEQNRVDREYWALRRNNNRTTEGDTE
ncbi:bifunctional DNA primase/polymerase [Streptomyces sp. NBC_00243]|uniref:bifunctional DNA primase/polymerase n=1 Tax=Streptomyces sp. NBC_00243 TaxID=2975688 RepID=UPI002DDA53C3|nr:bifunctional DNA primase/polymerase [Streptomyces sp. NBC_00243]WRZ22173.1 bifunctional DNA primase/polymerase [Streptomyces sp. NBC_00243]